MLDVSTITKAIMKIANDSGDLITNLKMQKLLYYAQAWYMVNNNGELLFEEPIEAWKFGPVVPVAFEKLKKNRNKAIEMQVSENDIKDLNKNQIIYIKEFCENFLKYSATELVAMTHNELPWKEAWDKGEKSIISTATMYNFYKDMLYEQKEA